MGYALINGLVAVMQRKDYGSPQVAYEKLRQLMAQYEVKEELPEGIEMVVFSSHEPVGVDMTDTGIYDTYARGFLVVYGASKYNLFYEEVQEMLQNFLIALQDMKEIDIEEVLIRIYFEPSDPDMEPRIKIITTPNFSISDFYDND